MKLAIEFKLLNDSYTLVLSINHKNTCILRTNYQQYFINQTKQQVINDLRTKLNELCMNQKPLELFSDDNIHRGSNLSLSFAHRAFIYAHTIMPSNGQEVTTNNVFLLRADEETQFYCELHKLWITLNNQIVYES